MRECQWAFVENLQLHGVSGFQDNLGPVQKDCFSRVVRVAPDDSKNALQLVLFRAIQQIEVRVEVTTAIDAGDVHCHTIQRHCDSHSILLWLIYPLRAKDLTGRQEDSERAQNRRCAGRVRP
jgi:hypothetical protein